MVLIATVVVVVVVVVKPRALGSKHWKHHTIYTRLKERRVKLSLNIIKKKNILELCPGPGNRDGKCGKREGIPSPSRSPREAGFRDGRSLTRVNVFGLFTRNLRSFLIVPKTSNIIDHKGSKSALKCSNSTTIEQRDVCE